jgi:hypothetical protein
VHRFRRRASGGRWKSVAGTPTINNAGGGYPTGTVQYDTWIKKAPRRGISTSSG